MGLVGEKARKLGKNQALERLQWDFIPRMIGITFRFRGRE